MVAAKRKTGKINDQLQNVSGLDILHVEAQKKANDGSWDLT